MVLIGTIGLLEVTTLPILLTAPLSVVTPPLVAVTCPLSAVGLEVFPPVAFLGRRRVCRSRCLRPCPLPEVVPSPDRRALRHLLKRALIIPNLTRLLKALNRCLQQVRLWSPKFRCVVSTLYSPMKASSLLCLSWCMCRLELRVTWTPPWWHPENEVSSLPLPRTLLSFPMKP